MAFKSNYLLVLLIMAGLMSCHKKNEESNPEPSTTNGYNKRLILENIGNNVIIPDYLDLKTVSDDFYSSCLSFQTTTTEAQLEIVQSDWRKLAKAWKMCELYKIGPGTDLIYGYYSSIDYNPTSPSSIESSITGGTTIDNSYIESLGATVKGLPALEYLLFDRSNGNTAILNQFSGTDENKIKRMDYLVALSENLMKKATNLYEAWIPTKGNYIAAFIENDGVSIGSSISELVNQMIYLLESVKNNKIGQPLGKMNSSVAEPSTVEAGESESSLSHIRNNIVSIENAFLGKGQAGDIDGFDDLLDYQNVKYSDVLLTDTIKAQFKEVYQALDGITPPLQTAVVDSPQSVEKLYTELTTLQVLLKVDMMSSLGVLLTISDNDGD